MPQYTANFRGTLDRPPLGGTVTNASEIAGLPSSRCRRWRGNKAAKNDDAWFTRTTPA